MFRRMKNSFWKVYNSAQFRFDGYYRFIAILFNPFYFIRKNLFFHVRAMAPELHGCILDFGCGSKPYKDCFLNCSKYVGCDVENDSHPHLNEDIDVFYDGKKLPFPEESFDGVFSSEVFEHVFNLEDMIKELNRVLKVNGKMLVTVPFVWNEHEQPYDYARYTSFGISDLLQRNGFEIIELRKSNTYSETLWQMWIEYLRKVVADFTNNGYLRILAQVFLLCPMTIIGIIFSWILPKNDTFFNNLIVLCRKRECGWGKALPALPSKNDKSMPT